MDLSDRFFLSDIKILKAAKQHFAIVDPVMSALTVFVGEIDLPKRSADFDSLTRIIIGQQISRKAADAIIKRIRDASFSNTSLSPSDTFALGTEGLKVCGLSGPKASYILGVAELLVTRPDFLDEIMRLPLDMAYSELIQIKGIGPWSAKNFLLFSLRAFDVFPDGDLALDKGLGKLYCGIQEGMNVSWEGIVKKWSPYRGIAALYLWEWSRRGMPSF